MPPYGYVIIVLSVLTLILFLLYRSTLKNCKKRDETNDYLHSIINSLREENKALSSEKAALKTDLDKQIQRFNQLQSQLSNRDKYLHHILTAKAKTTMPWLAGMIADFMTCDLEILAKKLDWGYNVQREKKVASIREIRATAKQKIQENRVASYQLAYLCQIFPAIEDILSSDYKPPKPSTSLPLSDPTRNYLSSEEWHNLSQIERDQLALDRYIQSHSKSKWQIGRDYELAVAYEYSKKGYSVDTHGSYMGLEDLGRDIIAKKPGTTLIIQCKHWSESKTIHEKHIYQLYGTTISYIIENPNEQHSVHGVFVTTASLSRIARQAAEMLGISVVERHKMISFPRIKCNIGHDESGCRTQIYHLPMDDQYDSAKIDQPGEFYAFTVQEAVEKGFRRAYKWHGSS